uniref:FTH domain-containing protein n=1 Tax=Panagrellus redivivus TaxID=6233 RepID=A0A7E4VMF3_PANRE
MDRIDYQQYDYVHYRVKHLLREWKHLKPHFEAKLAITTSSTVKSLYIHSLYGLATRLDKANADLKSIIDDIHDICKSNGLGTTFIELIYKPNIGGYLRNIATSVTCEIYTLKRKFEGDDNKLPFEALPYEFQSRLVALLPPNDVFAFKFTGKIAAKHVYKRGMWFVNLIVVGNSIHYENVKSSYGGDPAFDISNGSCFLKLNRCYVQGVLCLNIGSPEKYDHAVKIVTGTYIFLELKGVFTWRQAIHLMNVSKNIKYVTLCSRIQLDEEEFDAFFEAVVQWLLEQKNVFTIDIMYVKLDLTFDYDDFFKAVVQWLLQKKGATMIDIQCPDLMDGFDPRLKECVENRTTYNVKFVDGWTVNFRLPQKP